MHPFLKFVLNDLSLLGETDEIWALEQAATAHSAFAEAAVDLAEIQKLASEVAESAYKATAAAERSKGRAEVVDELLNTAVGQAQVGSIVTEMCLPIIDICSIYTIFIIYC